MAKLNEKGQEILDPTPMAIPARFHRPPTLQEQIRMFTRTELSKAAGDRGFETFEDANDFDVDDEYDPTSPHELVLDSELGVEVTQEEAAFTAQGVRDFDSWMQKSRKPETLKDKFRKLLKPKAEQKDPESKDS